MREELATLTNQYIELSKTYLDLERLNFYLLSHHSTAIEGGTLTALETEIFLEKGLTAKGKPLEHHLMVKNHFEALTFILKSAQDKVSIETDFIKAINACVMKDTGSVHNTALGSFDSAKGDLRLVNVRAGITCDSYLNFQKVPICLRDLCKDLQDKISKVNQVYEINELAFLAHYQLVTIHPFVDGNGRSSRLLMNYIQAFHQLPMTVVFVEDRREYIEAIISTRKSENIQFFLDFMFSQHLKFLKLEIQKMKSIEKKSTKTKNIRLLF